MRKRPQGYAAFLMSSSEKKKVEVEKKRRGKRKKERKKMPKYFCDYCDIYLTHDSSSVRNAHNRGWKHKSSVRAYYEEFIRDNNIYVRHPIVDDTRPWRVQRRAAEGGGDRGGGDRGPRRDDFGGGGGGGFGTGANRGGPPRDGPYSRPPGQYGGGPPPHYHQGPPPGYGGPPPPHDPSGPAYAAPPQPFYPPPQQHGYGQ